MDARQVKGNDMDEADQYAQFYRCEGCDVVIPGNFDRMQEHAVMHARTDALLLSMFNERPRELPIRITAIN